MLAFGAAVCTAGAGASVAQQMPAMQAGGQRTFEFGAKVDAFYDSNLARASDAVAARRGLKKEDYVARPAVTANVVQPVGQQIIFLTGNAGYDFHRENKELDRGRADISGGVAGRVGPCQPILGASYKAAQSDLTDTEDLTSVKNLQETTTMQAGLTCGRPIGPGFVLSAQKSQFKNSAADRETSDSDTQNLTMAVNYTHPSLGAASVLYSYASSEFPNRIIPGRPVGDGFFQTSYGVSYKRNFGPRLNVDGVVSRTTVKREFAPPGVDQKFTSTTYAANANYRFGQRINFQLHGVRSVQPSNRAEKVYDILTSGEVVANYRLGSRYNIKVGHLIEDRDSNADTTVPTTRPTVTKSRLNATYAAVRYQQSDRLSLELDVRREDRKTDLPDFNYTSNRIGISANVGF
jgi:hypothetical protein